MSKDYYTTLNIDKKASKDEIKKAFRKLAHEYHPDKATGDEAKFKEINEAYGVLSDDTKRTQYDQFGSAAFNGSQGGGYGGGQGAGFGGFDFSGFTGQSGFGGGEGVEFDLGDIFGGIFGGGRGGGRGGRSRQAKGSDISVDIDITFKESIFGIDKQFSLHRTATCAHCKGSRGEPGTTLDICKTCNGNGQVIENRRSMFGNFEQVKQCDVCAGTGKIPKEKCRECKGKGINTIKDDITVVIPSGIESGEMLRVSGRGEAITGGTTGDLYVRIHVQVSNAMHSHSMRKEGNNLAMNQDIKLSDALLGGEVTLTTLDGALTLVIPQGVTHGEILRVRGKGVPYGPGSERASTSTASSTRRGDLMVHIHIHIPKKISKDAKKYIEELKKEGF